MNDTDLTSQILALAGLTQEAINELYAKPEKSQELSDALNQCGLKNGLEIVKDYIEHNELSVSFEHLGYMINELEADLPQSLKTDLNELKSKLEK